MLSLGLGLSRRHYKGGGGSSPVLQTPPVKKGQVDGLPVAGLKLDYIPGVYSGAVSQSAEVWRDGAPTGLTIFPYTRLLSDEGKILSIRETAVGSTGLKTVYDMPVETVIPGANVGYNPTDGTTVSQIAGATSQLSDFTGNSKHATQPVNGSMPIWGSRSLNSLPGLDFDGAVQGMDMDDNTYPYSAGTDWIVYIADNTSRNTIIGNSAVTPSNGRRYLSNHQVNYGNASLNNTPVTGVGVLQMSTINGASSGTQTQTLRTNNIDTTGTTPTRGGGVSAGMGLGGLLNGTNTLFNGVLFFHLSFGRDLTNAEKNIIGNCLTTYFGLAAWANI